MNRRVLLSGIALGLSGLAGCLGSGAGDTEDEPANDRTETADGGTASGGDKTTDAATQFSDVSLPVERSEMLRGAGKDAIPAIVDPVFGADWEGVTSGGRTVRLNDDSRVVGVERDGEARAYPLRILNWHEIVNDDFGGPLLVTFCPLCGSGVVAERTVGGTETLFGVSGLLWRNDLVMYDSATESLWSQIMATAVQGPRTGETLTLVPSTITTWGEWRANHPETKVLRPPPESATITDAQPRNYSYNPYASYSSSDRIGIQGVGGDSRLHPKTTVVGITDDGVSRAYPLKRIRKAGLVTDTVGSLPVVVAAIGDDTLVAYVRRIDGETVEATRDGEFVVLDGSRFRLLDGVAVDGPHEGAQLQRASELSSMFWFAWADFHRDSEIWSP